MTAYYTASGNPPAATRALSAQLRAEFQLIVDAFNSAQADILLRATLASPALTGVPTAPTAAAGTNTTQIATTAFVATQALAATLPAQTGNAGKLITTNGSTASWSNGLNATVLRWQDGTDATKQMAFVLSGLTTATTRTVTWPDKNGTVAMTSDVGSTLIATLTPTAAANVDALSTFSSSYDNYMVMIDGILPATDDTLVIRLATGGAADSASDYVVLTNGSTVTTTSTSMSPGGTVLAAGKGANAMIHILNANDATNNKMVKVVTTSQSTATPGWALGDATYSYIKAAAVSGIRFYWSGGANFAASGKIRIYGYNS